MNAIPVLAKFASTGMIGPVHCGASLNEIAAVLGPPWGIGRVSKRRRWPHLFSYGDVELCVCRCRRVTSMSIQTWRDRIELPQPGSKDAVSHPGDLTLAAVTAGLDAIGCPTQPVTHHQPPGQLTLRAEPFGATFTFQAHAVPELLLARVSSWTAVHDCTSPAEDVPDDGFGRSLT
ncbi:hypothetical protein [Streptomyces colonosanans]|uniref:Uncharacterized protein n=1 Tax=Streptomyces colonosanans TaxID=1428652 RepID=A0A1S2PN90_9ACTN|nr:hypothetical protein [Streptomyces colonosanans]OIJ94875.1 hypothetical protein BIV24_10195 [Streptomyces colonosanans]